MEEFCHELKTKIKDIYGVDPEAPSESSHIPCAACGEATVKPSTVLYGSSFPYEFFELSESDLPRTDLLLIAGTSLTVSPANQLALWAPRTAKRFIINRDPVGQAMGIDCSNRSERDLFTSSDCDEAALRLITELGWRGDLDAKAHLLPERSQALLGIVGEEG